MTVLVSLIILTALLFYVALPLLSREAQKKHYNGILTDIDERVGISGSVTTVRDGKIWITADHRQEDSDTPLVLVPQQTTFMSVSSDGVTEWIPWKRLLAVETGSTVMVYLPASGKRRTYCVFHEEKNAKAFRERLRERRMHHHLSDPATPFFVALGAFLEFAFFLSAFTGGELDTASSLALIAIFGKALPWAPPGLALTLWSHRIQDRAQDKKKRRQSLTVGYVLTGLGVLLNGALILFVIRGIAFSVR